MVFCLSFVWKGSKHGAALALQLMDVSLRVEEVREYAVHKSVGLLLEPHLYSVSLSPDLLSRWILIVVLP